MPEETQKEVTENALHDTSEPRSVSRGRPDRRSGVERRRGDRPYRGHERRVTGERRREAAFRRALETAGTVVEKAADAATIVAEKAADAATTVAEKAAGAGTAVADKATGAVGAVTHLAGTAATPIASAAGHRRAEAARLRELRAAAKRPLPSLWELHPEARRAALRELGIQTVPVDAIRGTAVAGSTQRRGDFLPLPKLRGSNWQGRWQRIRRAVDRLEPLPPVDLLRYGDEYWVVDGHNRVAAARYGDQVAIDASVVDLRIPGMARSGGPVLVGDQLTEERQARGALRAAIRAPADGRSRRDGTGR